MTKKRKDWRPFEEAREFARGLGLKRSAEWHDWCKSGERPPDIPTNPDKARSYKAEWRGWGDWLGTGNVATSSREYRSFEKAQEFVRGLGLHSLINSPGPLSFRLDRYSRILRYTVASLLARL